MAPTDTASGSPTSPDTRPDGSGGWLVRNARVGSDVQDRPVDLRIRAGHLVEVGPDLVAEAEVQVDVAGRRVVAGLRDAHVHFTTWALHRRTADLNDRLARATSATQAATEVVHARGADRRAWIRGAGFRPAAWGDVPHRSLLDAAAPDQPVVLVSQDVHSSWWSSAALAAVGIEHEDGFLRERESWEAIARIPPPPAEQVDAAVDDAIADAASRGVTSIVDFEFGGAVDAWRRRGAAGPLRLRVAAGIMHDEIDEAIHDGLQTGMVVDDHGLVRVGALKLFTDGALGSRTAWCDHDYEGDPGNRGRQLLGEEELRHALLLAQAAGLHPAVHAIGDAANRMVLDAFAAASVRGTVEHAQLLQPGDLRRFAGLARAASVQPSHAVDDRDLADHWWADRLDRAYPLRSLQAAGVQLRLGSDAPVAPLDPWRTIEAAVRRSVDDRPPWEPSQAIDLVDALRWSVRTTLAPASPADLVVLDDDPFDVAPQDLGGIRVHATMCAGRWTHGHDGLRTSDLAGD